MNKKSKKYLSILEKIDKQKKYPIKEAIDILQKNPSAKFDSTIELVFNLNINPKKAEENLRGSLALPFNNGKKKKILVICETEKILEVKKTKVDFVGSNELIEKINKEKWFDFDLIITTPKMMPALSKLGKFLGPKGLMPNLKTGTISNDLIKTIDEFQKGKVEYRVDKNGILHFSIAKISFPSKNILKNAETIMKYVKKIKPNSVKNNYIKTIFLSTTMSPSIKLEEN